MTTRKTLYRNSFYRNFDKWSRSFKEEVSEHDPAINLLKKHKCDFKIHKYMNIIQLVQILEMKQ